MNGEKTIRPKERDSILQSLRAGVVPRIGLHLVQVGRAQEVESIVNDIERICDSGSSIRFIIGEYGAGKTFFLHLIRTVAIEKNVVTAHADLTPDRRIQATGGQARNLFAELMRNVSTRTKPDGGALASIVERFISSAISESKEKSLTVESVINSRLAQLTEMVGGYDFAQVIASYWKAFDTGNDLLKNSAIRWLRAEFTTKTDARSALGVRTIIDDSNVYDYLKLMSLFIRLAGYNGLLIGLDELVNLYKLANTQARNSNYEQILRILNDSLQGISVGLGFILCGTPDFLMDTRRGLFSYQALQSRLAENSFAKSAGVVDQSGPVIRLPNLTQEDLYVLLTKLRHIYSSGQQDKYLVPDEALTAFMTHCSKKIGDAYFRTPRTTIRAFIDMLYVLEQNKNITWKDLLEGIKIEKDTDLHQDDVIDEPAIGSTTGNTQNPEGPKDELASFKL
jgi:P-loop Domain of unknown function (DUF2791)